MDEEVKMLHFDSVKELLNYIDKLTPEEKAQSNALMEAMFNIEANNSK